MRVAATQTRQKASERFPVKFYLCYESVTGHRSVVWCSVFLISGGIVDNQEAQTDCHRATAKHKGNEHVVTTEGPPVGSQTQAEDDQKKTDQSEDTSRKETAVSDFSRSLSGTIV